MTNKLLIAITLAFAMSLFAMGMNIDKRMNSNPTNFNSGGLVPVNFNRTFGPSMPWQRAPINHVNTPFMNSNSTRTNVRVMPWASAYRNHPSSTASHPTYRPNFSGSTNRQHAVRPNGVNPIFRNDQWRYHHRYFDNYAYFRYFPDFYFAFSGFPFWDWYFDPFLSISFGYPYAYDYYYGPYGYPAPYYYSGSSGYDAPYSRIGTDIKPDNTQVFVDGYYIGLAKDHKGWWRTYPVNPGKHDVSLQLNGYEPYTMDFDVQPDKYYKVQHMMVPLTSPQNAPQLQPQSQSAPDTSMMQQRYGLILNVEPSNSAVYIDNQYMGTYDEIMKDRNKIMLDVGVHTIDVSYPNYVTYSSKFEVKPQKDAILNIVLMPEKAI